MRIYKVICLVVTLLIFTVAQANVPTSLNAQKANLTSPVSRASTISAPYNVHQKPILTGYIYVADCSPTGCCYYKCNDDGSVCVQTGCTVVSDKKDYNLDDSRAMKLALQHHFRDARSTAGR
jgi:hypothetical protein